MAVISTLAVNLIARTGVFEKGMRKSRGSLRDFARQSARTRQRLMGLAKGFLLAAGIGGIGYFTKQLIDAASAAEETQAKFDTVFKNLSGMADKWAMSFGKSVGRANQDVKKWMAGLQDTFVPLGIARDEAFKLSKNLVKLAVDVASFNNAVDETVIRDFTSALVGNHETVRKFGIIISESALKQEAFAQGINKTYKQLTDLEKVQLRYSLIMKGTTDAQGDAIRTQSSYANQMKMLQANWKNLQELIGLHLLPAATDLVKIINQKYFSDLSSSMLGFNDVLAMTNLKWLAFKQGALEGKAALWELADAWTNLDELFATTPSDTYKVMAEEARKRAREIQAEIDKGYSALMLSITKPKSSTLPEPLKPPAVKEDLEAAKERVKAMDRLVATADRLKLSLRSPLQILKDFTLELQKMYDIGALSLVQVGELMRSRARELWDFTKEIKTKVAPETQYRFVGGQGRQFDPRNFIPGANMEAGRWLQIQSPEVKELREANTTLKLSDQKLDMMLDVLRRQSWG